MQQLDTPHAVAAWLDDPHRAPACVELRDLEAFHDRLAACDLPGSLFLGCDLPPAVASRLVASGASVVGDLPPRRFRVHRPHLYDVDELFSGFRSDDPNGHLRTLDHRIYEEYLDDGGPEPWNIAVSLAQRLHDHAITDGIRTLCAGRRVVAIMGGHGLERRDPTYRQVAHMARTLTRSGYLLASGGGPGAMEATHLGAWFAGRPADALDKVLDGAFVRRPEGAPTGKEYADPDWLHRAMAVREAWPLSAAHRRQYPSLGIPTWLYGHEPPAVFATHIAKYFANSVREDGLLALAKHGVIFAPGSAGTIQEIFQDLTQNHYGTQGMASPMVLFDRDYWTGPKPVWPLLAHLAEGQAWGELLTLTSDPDEAVAAIRGYDPLHHLAGSPDRVLESTLRRALGLRANVRFRHVAESVAPVARALDTPDAWADAAGPLLRRLAHRRAPGAEARPGSVATSHGPDAWQAWLCGSLGDDWLAPARALEVLGKLHHDGSLGDARWLPDAHLPRWPGEVPGKGVLLRLRQGRLSVWSLGLAD